jgi:glycosyltransferase involved in cell wall biosynthesis
MKIAVYTIAKNEAQFVQRWFDSAKEADSLHILDTGSTDNTVTLARDLGIDVARWEISPWRFDKARNLSLDLVPEDTDLCIALDMDEVLVEGWREHLEAAYADGVTRPRYRYTWSWVGSKPGLVYGGDKIHARHGYYWKHPVHEVLTPCHNEREVQGWYGLEIHHHPDSTKSRGQYLSLLELAVREDPEDDRNAHYLAREYFYAGQLDEAKAEFQRHLGLPSAKWGAERAQSYRFLYKIDGHHLWLERALDEDPGRRETLVDLAFYWYQHENWTECLKAATAALAIKERPLEYLTEAEAWGPMAHDLAGIAAFRLGYYHQAAYHGMEALKLSPYEDRLVSNLDEYRKAAA